MNNYLFSTLLFLSGAAFGQSDTHHKVLDSIRYVTLMPHCLDQEQPSPDAIFWNVVKLKLDATEALIEKIDDTTETAAPVRWFGGYWTVADISYKALEEIIKGIPTFELLNIQYDAQKGYAAYWYHLRSDIKKRKQFKKNLQSWYHQNKLQLAWVKQEWDGTACFYQNPNQGYYEIKKGISEIDAELLKKFRLGFDAAILSNEKEQLAPYFRFPFYCQPCAEEYKQSNTVTLKVTRKIFFGKSFQTHFTEKIAADFRINHTFDINKFQQSAEENHKFYYLYTIVPPDEKWEGSQGIIYLEKIKNDIKITGIDTIP